jgi:hypothetical protein
MRNKRLTAICLALALSLLLITGGTVVLGQTSAGFNLEWNVVGSGGGESASANHRVNGTIGQGIADQSAASTNFGLSSGYWFVATATPIPTATPEVSQESYLPFITQ